MSPDRLLLALAAIAGEEGYAVPQITSDQARRAAEQLISAAGLARVEPQQAIAAAPAEAPVTAPPTPAPPAGRRSSMDTPTQQMPLVAADIAARGMWHAGRPRHRSWSA